MIMEHCPGQRVGSAGKGFDLLRQESSCKMGIQAKRKKAGWHYDCLPKIIAG